MPTFEFISVTQLVRGMVFSVSKCIGVNIKSFSTNVYYQTWKISSERDVKLSTDRAVSLDKEELECIPLL